MAALRVGDAVELLKGGAARPVPARCSHQRRHTTRHRPCLQHRHIYPPPALNRYRIAGPFWRLGAAGLVIQVRQDVYQVQLENGEHTLNIRPRDLRRRTAGSAVAPALG